MNKKVLMQIGCVFTMFILEMIAAYIDPSSVMFNILMALSVLMIPTFVIAGPTPKVPERTKGTENTESPLAKAA